MSSFTTRRFPATTPDVEEKPQDKDLETIVSRIDEQLRELKDFLKTDTQDSEGNKEPESHVYMARVSEPGKESDDTHKVAESPPLPHNWVKFAVTPMEAEAIMERVGKFDQDTKLMDRLEKVERQNRRLTILGSIFCTLMFVFLMLSTYLLRQHYRWDVSSLWPRARVTTSAQPAEKVTPPAETVAQTPAAPVPASQEVAKPPEAPSLPSPTAPQAASQGSSSVSGTQPQPAPPATKYVGSITSNRYHSPDCKWAKTIIPKKMREFTSVAEAQKAGYRQCPTCQPPLSDPLESTPSGQN